MWHIWGWVAKSRHHGAQHYWVGGQCRQTPSDATPSLSLLQPDEWLEMVQSWIDQKVPFLVLDSHTSYGAHYWRVFSVSKLAYLNRMPSDTTPIFSLLQPSWMIETCTKLNWCRKSPLLLWIHIHRSQPHQALAYMHESNCMIDSCKLPKHLDLQNRMQIGSSF